MPATVLESPLTTQENALALAMSRGIGDVTLRYTVDQGGDRIYQLDSLGGPEIGRLVAQFAADPKERLAHARESLFAISRDTRLSADTRHRRVGRYLDAYTNLTVMLDHAAFPSTGFGNVREGIPEYIPDCFVDMGRERTLTVAHRDREQIVVDKREILTKYRPLLMEIFETDYSRMTLDEKKLHMAKRIGVHIWNSMTDQEKMAANGGRGVNIDLGGGRVRLSELSEGVCRHQALTFQVLAQAVGLKSILVKGKLNGENHAANMIRVGGKWHIYDVANPVYRTSPKTGRVELMPGRYPVDGPPPAGGAKEYRVSKLQPNDTRYALHSTMYWWIGRRRR